MKRLQMQSNALLSNFKDQSGRAHQDIQSKQRGRTRELTITWYGEVKRQVMKLGNRFVTLLLEQGNFEKCRSERMGRILKIHFPMNTYSLRVVMIIFEKKESQTKHLSVFPCKEF